MNDVLIQACLLSQEDWIQTLRITDEAHTFSKRHQKTMAKMFDRMRKDKYHRLTRTAVRTLIAAAVLLSVATTAIAFAPKEHSIKRFINHSVYQVIDGAPVKQADALTSSVPEGFELIDEVQDDYAITQKYTFNDYWITIDRCSIDTEIYFDTESYNSREIQKNGITYILYRTQTTNNAVWTDGDYTYNISSNLPEEALLDVAYCTK